MAPRRFARSGGRLGYVSLGFLRDPRIGRVLRAHGWDLVPGPFSSHLDAVAIWGNRPVAARGLRFAKRRGVPTLFLEDVLFRSVGSGRGEPLIGLLADGQAPYFEARAPTDLSDLLNAPGEITATEAARAEALIHRITRSGLSKYNPRPAANAPAPGYVLVVDQVPGDASIPGALASPDTFRDMLAAARRDHPGRTILVRQHPRAGQAAGYGHFDAGALGEGVALCPPGVEASEAIRGAHAVYVVSSQMGFEAMLHGHRPVTFGAPFYAGWGLSEDRMQVPNRSRTHGLSSFVHRVLVEYPLWYDPYLDRAGTPEAALDGLAARIRGDRIRAIPRIAIGMRRWKRRHLPDFLGTCTYREADPSVAAVASRSGARVVAWASRCPDEVALACSEKGVCLERMEDGFLRSVGLGAALHRPLSLALDDLGIYYDPRGPSRLENLIRAAGDLPEEAIERARRLRERIVALRLTKYNLAAGSALPPRAGRFRILVPGQVEDDASIRTGTTSVGTNGALIRATRDAKPEAEIFYKPHPDVEAGLRTGAVSPEDLACADHVLQDIDATSAIDGVDAVWTMTSLLGFEALLRGIPVTVLGQPFYAGWGLTDDRGGAPSRRDRPVSLDGLVHAALIDYPIYVDPRTGLDAPVEVALDRLAEAASRRSPTHRLRSRVLARLRF